MRTSLRTLLVLGLAAAPIHASAQALGGDLADLARIREDVTTRRVSSYDRSGGNNDRIENIGVGETREIFNVEGAGIINHIWITIAPPPPELSRNDIVIRMYWDGSDFPSVESPIGPFFGQGWDESYPFSSLPLAAGPVEGRGLVSYWAMPFASGARIEIENQSERKINAFYYYVAYWYQAPPLNALPPIPDRASRQPRPFTDVMEIHRWRHEWRQNQGADAHLWGNEKTPE